MGFSRRRSRTYIKAQFTIAGHQIKDVGIRLKGASTYTYSAGTLKRSFKVDFNRYVEEQEFLGFKKLNLNNNVTDPTQVREAVTYKAYRDAGVPGSRTCFSRVFLTVNGFCKNEYLGMYTIVEQFDKPRGTAEVLVDGP